MCCGRPSGDKESTKWSMLSPCCGRPSGYKKDQKMVIAVTKCCERPGGDKKTRKWSLLPPCSVEDIAVTKDHKIFPGAIMRYRRPHSDRKDQKMLLAVTMCCGKPRGDKKSRKWSLLPPYGAEDLAETKRAENGPCCHHVMRKTSR